MAFKDSAKVDKFLRGDGTVDGSPVEGTVVEIPLFTRFEHHPNGGLALGFLNHQQYVKRHVLRIWMSKVRSKSNDQFILGDCNLNEDRPNKLTFNGSSCPFELRIPKCLELFVFFQSYWVPHPRQCCFSEFLWAAVDRSAALCCAWLDFQKSGGVMASIELGTNTCWEKTHTTLQSKASVFDMTVAIRKIVFKRLFSGV